MNIVYSSYKDVDESWLHSIPSHWTTAYLSSVFDEHKQKNKGMINSNLLSLSYGRIIRKDINGKSGLLPESFETYNVVDKDDIVLRLTDLQNDHKSLRTGLCREAGIVTSAYVTLRKRKEDLNAAFFRYYLHAFDVHKCFYGMGDGVRQSLSYEGIKRLTLSIPPEQEQRQIVKYLDYQTKQINKLSNANKQKITLLVEYLNKVFDTAILGTTKRIKLKYLVHLCQDFIVPNPEELYSKAGMYNRGRGIFKREPMFGKDLGTSSFQWIRKDCLLISGQFAWEGATYVSTENDEGALISHRYYPLAVDSQLVSPAYLWAYFMSDEGFMKLNLCSHGAAGRNRPLNIRELMNVEIPVIENISDLARIEDAVKLIIAHRLIDKRQADLLEEFKQKLISDVVTGQIDVRGIEIPEFECVEEMECSLDNDDAEDDDAEVSDEEV